MKSFTHLINTLYAFCEFVTDHMVNLRYETLCSHHAIRDILNGYKKNFNYILKITWFIEIKILKNTLTQLT